MSQENISVIKNIYAAFGQGNIPAVFELFDPTIEWIAADNSPAAAGSPYHGLDEVREGVFLLIGKEFSGLTMRVDDILDAGEKIVVLGMYNGVRKLTEKRFQAQFAHIWTIAARKVVRFQQYTDTYQLAESAK